VRVYLDSAPVIYVVERVEPFWSAVLKRLSGSETELFASDMTRLECRVKPLRDGDTDLLKDFDDYFQNAVAQIVSLSRQVIDLATEIRAKHRIKTPDSIHLAAAIVSCCDVFLTNDHRLDSFTDIAIEVTI